MKGDTVESIREEKKRMRKEIRALRRGLGDTSDWDKSVERIVLAMEEYRRAGCIFCFVSCKGEPETRGIINHALTEGKRVLVPRCMEDGLMDAVEITSLAQLKPKTMGILEPDASLPAVPKEDIDFAVVPALAYTPGKQRLGQGGGYYDRFLEGAKFFACGVCYAMFVYQALPAEGFDRPVNCFVTENAVFR